MKRYELFAYAGERQRTILFELEKLGEITRNPETLMWRRGAHECSLAKDLLSKTDAPLDELVDDLEKDVLRIEGEASMKVVMLTGSARQRLNALKEKRKFIYNK